MKLTPKIHESFSPSLNGCIPSIKYTMKGSTIPFPV
jgi:hypothetical protein